MKALKMSIIHVVAFVISWTPYAIMGTWDTIDRVFQLNTSDKIDPILRDVLYLTAVLNSCINPFIYGTYYLSGGLRKGPTSPSDRRHEFQKEKIVCLKLNEIEVD